MPARPHPLNVRAPHSGYRKPMKMGEIEKLTGVNRETIRVYIRLGLVPAPHKPKPTVAHYNEEHVRTVLAVRRLQRDHHMTLEQIGQLLNGQPTTARLEAHAFTQLDELLSARVGSPDQPVPIAALAATNPHAASDAEALELLGAVDRVETADGFAVSPPDARMIAIWAEMRAAGFVEAVDFYPETMDHYVRTAQYLAYWEARRFIAKTRGVIDEEKAADMLQVGLPLMLDFFGLLRMKFLLRNLHEAEQERVAGDDGSQRPPPELPLNNPTEPPMAAQPRARARIRTQTRNRP